MPELILDGENPYENHAKLLEARNLNKGGCAEFCREFKVIVASAWPVLSSLFFVFIVTFIIFPGAFFDEHFEMTDSFTNVTLIIILVFNVMDTVGRKFGSMVNLPDGVVYMLSLLRLALVVLTIVIVKDDGDSNAIEKDAVKMLNLALFAFTNGFVST